MKHKTLFRLLLKLLGVWAFIMGVAGALSYLSTATNILISPYANARWEWWLNLARPVFEMAIGLYLFFGGKWIVDKAIPGNRPYCHECGYDLTGAVGDTCNECGTPFRAPVSSEAGP